MATRRKIARVMSACIAGGSAAAPRTLYRVILVAQVSNLLAGFLSLPDSRSEVGFGHARKICRLGLAKKALAWESAPKAREERSASRSGMSKIARVDHQGRHLVDGAPMAATKNRRGERAAPSAATIRRQVSARHRPAAMKSLRCGAATR